MKYEDYYEAINMFWPNKWWENENQFNENIEADLLINGDFIPISVVSVGKIIISKQFKGIKTPYVKDLQNIYIKSGTKITFRGFTFNQEKQDFQIILSHDTPGKTATYEKNGLIMLQINVASHTIELSSDEMVKDNVELLIEPIIKVPNEINKTIHKYKLKQLQQTGTILCFEGFVLSAKYMSDKKSFEINLFHNANEFNEKFGDTILKLKFTFDPQLYNENKANTKQHSTQMLVIESYIRERKTLNNEIYYKGGWTKNVTYPNPIVQTGVNFTLRIDLGNNYFNISVNEAVDPICYESKIITTFGFEKLQIPVWATEWIMIKGDVDKIKFGEESEKCKSKIKPNNYNLNIIHVPENNRLKDGSLIIIKGKVKDDVISINFLYKAIELNKLIGENIFQLNFTVNTKLALMRTYKEGILPTKQKCENNTKVSDFCSHKHELELIKNEYFNFNILVKSDRYIWRYKVSGKWYSYKHIMPEESVQYINVLGLEKHPKFDYIIKLDKLY
uniref:Galectin n=1 Tax=Meloidogyne hapla TaxID=6305 RepID=A0A1I8BJ11_MELHA